MKLSYLLLPLLVCPMASLFGASAAACASATASTAIPEADAKAADTKENAAIPAASASTAKADAKTTLNPAFPFFKEWVDKNRCQRDGCEGEVFNEDDTTSPCPMCHNECETSLQRGTPCWHMLTQVLENHKLTFPDGFLQPAYGIIHSSYGVNEVTNTLIGIPKELIPLITGYAYNPHRILNVIMVPTEQAPMSRVGTFYDCTYNLDTKELLSKHTRVVTEGNHPGTKPVGNT